MDFLLKSLSPRILLGLLPMILLKLGNYFKGRDADNVGADDAFGNVLIALAPAVEAIDGSNETAFRKALQVTYTTLGNYLNK